MPRSSISVRILLTSLALLITLGLTSLYTSPLPQLEPMMNSLEGKLSVGKAPPGAAGGSKKDAPTRPDWAPSAELSAIVGLGIALAVLLPLVPYRWGFTLTLFMGTSLLVFNHYYFYVINGWMLSPLYPLLCLAAVYPLVTLVRLAFERGARKRMQQAFSRHLSDSAIERIMLKPGGVSLDAQRRELSIISSSMSGFSKLSESMPPDELTDFLHLYLSEMSHIILDEGGTLDKIQGDAITAFWNAPLDQPDHPVLAVRAALRCRDHLAELKERLKQITGAEAAIRVGIHTADAVVGEMGSSRSSGYTVLGSAARLASRIEGANYLFGTSILMSRETWQRTEGRFEGRELGELQVPGHGGLVTLVEPLGVGGKVDLEPYEPFLNGLELVRNGEFPDALRIFEQLTEDPVARVYAKRLRKLAIEGGNWVGVWRQTYG